MTGKKGAVNKKVKKSVSASVKKKSPAKNSDKPQTEKEIKKMSSKNSVKPKKFKIPDSATFLADKKWLTAQRELLLSERQKYTNSAERLAAEAAALMADREPGDVQFDEESGEGDTIAVERDRDLALSAAARQAVEEIDAALVRMEEKTYGLCLVSGDVIPKERLEAIPEASVCVEHKTSMFN